MYLLEGKEGPVYLLEGKAGTASEVGPQISAAGNQNTWRSKFISQRRSSRAAVQARERIVLDRAAKAALQLGLAQTRCTVRC